ncbi:hypothetical protein AVEN_128524-1 [Araneus ventricosus]|uniref:Uncharacterized protein n=1 Tax=Araneus ventricosus TaxID=182803 RepID=A0A4Y2HN81_ARAVE|nr:hypothetical protein AVEN_128524-1 [Araneus ventricosus]
MKQLMGKTPTNSVEYLVVRNFGGSKINTTVGGFQSIHSIPTWCGLWIQVIDPTFSKSFQHFCCKNGILLDICFSSEDQLEADAYVVVYTITDRSSFEKAVDILFKLRERGCTMNKAVILVGNKSDLVRSRAITADGK